MSTRGTLVVGLSVLALLAGVGPVGGFDADTSDASFATDETAERTSEGMIEHTWEGMNEYTSEGTVSRSTDAFAQYKVSLNNVTLRTWLLRNATVLNATVQNVEIHNATTENGLRTNVTLTNVTVGRFVIERGRFKNVTAERLVIRNKSILSVPGGDFIDPNVEDHTIDRHWTTNQTVSGVVIDEIAVDAAALCENTTLGPEADEGASFDPRDAEEQPDITVENGAVEEALIIRGKTSNWSVGSVQQPDLTNGSLPEGCSRG